MTDAPTSQQTLLPAQTCVDALVQYGGNIHLAAEKLHTTESIMTASIAADPVAHQSLTAQLRTMSTLMTFDMLRTAKVMMDSVMTELEPQDFMKFYLKLMDTFNAATAPSQSGNPTTNINIQEHVISMLPPHVRQALVALKGGGGSSNTRDGIGAPSRVMPMLTEDDGEADPGVDAA